jgi:hypothetical protein
VGPAGATPGFAQAARRQHVVAEKGPVVVGEQDGQAGRYASVLVGVVEDDYVRSRMHLQHGRDGFGPPFAHGNRDGRRKLAVHLVGFVAERGGRVGMASQPKALRLPAVAPAEGSHPVLRLQQADEVLHVGRFAGTAHGQVAHAQHGHPETVRFFEVQVVAFVPHGHDQGVEPAKGQQEHAEQE